MSLSSLRLSTTAPVSRGSQSTLIMQSSQAEVFAITQVSHEITNTGSLAPGWPEGDTGASWCVGVISLLSAFMHEL